MRLTTVLALMMGVLTIGCASSQPTDATPADASGQELSSAPADASSSDSTLSDTTAQDATTADATSVDAPSTDGPLADTSPLWVAGKRKLSGGAYFFDAKGVGAIELQKDVTGAVAYLLEFPEIKQPVAKDGSFSLDGLPEGGEFTIAVVHPDYYPSLSPVIAIGSADVTDVNFQVVTHLIAAYLGAVVGFDAYDATQCQMVVTVSSMSDSQGTWWAPGEPGATATIEPPLPAQHGPFYFNTNVIPDKALAMTTTDGGVLVGGAKPGIYTWKAHKEGLKFSSQRLKCVGGWLTNGVPPFGLQASKAAE